MLAQVPLIFTTKNNGHNLWCEISKEEKEHDSPCKCMEIYSRPQRHLISICIKCRFVSGLELLNVLQGVSYRVLKKTTPHYNAHTKSSDFVRMRITKQGNTLLMSIRLHDTYINPYTDNHKAGLLYDVTCWDFSWYKDVNMINIKTLWRLTV